jgi:hypothetical protein
LPASCSVCSMEASRKVTSLQIIAVFLIRNVV